MQNSWRNIFIVTFFMASVVSRADEVLKWNQVLLGAIRVDKTAPPKASRAMAMVHVSAFDAVNAISKSHESYRLTQTAPATTSKVAAVASAAHKVLKHLFPAQGATFDAQLNSSLAAIADGASKSDGVSIGQLAASEIISLRSTDDGTVGGAAPAPAVGIWEPTLPAFAPYLLPGWGKLTPWTMTSSSQFRGVGPAKLNTGEYTKTFNETKSLGEKNSATRTADQTQIAKFWADGPGTATPPGHWNVIAQGISQSRKLTLDQNARLFALLNLVLADAAIAAWDMKFTFYNWRPITAIRKADLDGNKHTDPDPNWLPLINTPPFPDYVSGHSTFSESAAEVLKHYFGNDNIAFSTTSDDLPGVTRSFGKLSEAADEAGRSRIYGGIHFAFADKDAQQAGRKLAHQAFVRYLRAK